jgi:hypothetical protein
MGDKPGKYWDHREARWVRYPEQEPVHVPPQAEAVDDQLPAAAEADVRSG